jgi:hypothetical protein
MLNQQINATIDIDSRLRLALARMYSGIGSATECGECWTSLSGPIPPWSGQGPSAPGHHGRCSPAWTGGLTGRSGSSRSRRRTLR